MKIIFVFISTLCLLNFKLIALNPDPQDNQSYYVTKKGEKVILTGWADYGKCPNEIQECLNFQNAKGNSDYIVWDKIEKVNLHGTYYLTFPVDEKGKNKEMMELVLQNEKYKLFRLFGRDQYDFLYIYDMNNKLIETKVKLTKGKIQTGMKLNTEENNPEVMKLILKYFPDCNDLNARMQANFDNKKNLLSQIGYRACENAPDPEMYFK